MNVAASSPCSRRLIVLAAWIPDCIATSATPGRSRSAIMSPIAKTSGWPGSVQSSFTTMRPARSHVAPPASASSRASGDACTPAAQIFVRHTIRSVAPSASRTSTPNGSTSVTIDLLRIVTPSRRSSAAAFAESRSPNVARISLPPSTSRTSASAGSIRRKLPWRPVRASSAIWPAISTPVGPPPTTTKVSQARRASGSGSFSAISKAPKIRPRSSRASSIVFIPGAKRENSS